MRVEVFIFYKDKRAAYPRPDPGPPGPGPPVIPNKSLSVMSIRGLSLSEGPPAARVSESLSLSLSLSLVFGGCTFPPVSLGPAGDCPCRD